MEIGGLGDPTAPAVKIAGVAQRVNTALVTIPVLHTEVHIALDLQDTQDPATPTPAVWRCAGGTTSGRHAGGEA